MRPGILLLGSRAVTARIKEKIAERRSRWDSYCNQCGLCCFQKDYRKGRVLINMHRPCRYLDTESKLCLAYEDRFAVCKDCKKVTLYHALFSSIMPEQCGYVQRLRKWKFLIPSPALYHRSNLR